MYCNVVYTDLVIKGLVRVFVFLQKENAFITLMKRKKPNAFLAMQMEHSRLKRLISPEKVFTRFFHRVAVIFTVYSSHVALGLYPAMAWWDE